ncbi:MAG: phospholipase [Muribaculaceae bacterium]|nr:phospholipase [Muribaculaceae bacterium]
MIVALYILLALVVVGTVLRLTHKPGDESVTENNEAAEGCCGRHAVCEKFADAALADEPVYFDDEELDSYAGRSSESYTQEELETFRDVLFTLLPHDLAPWAHSLEMRGIAMPDELRDEFLMLFADAGATQLTPASDA